MAAARTVAALGLRERGRKTLGQCLAHLAIRTQALLRGKLAQLVGYAHGNLCTHVGHDERVLEVLPKLLVNLAAHVEDLVDGLAGLGEALPQAVSEPHQASTTFPVARSSRWDTT